jgi:hypothetical protein
MLGVNVRTLQAPFKCIDTGGTMFVALTYLAPLYRAHHRDMSDLGRRLGPDLTVMHGVAGSGSAMPPF